MKLLQLKKVHSDDNGSEMMTKTLSKEKLVVRVEVAGMGGGDSWLRSLPTWR